MEALSLIDVSAEDDLFLGLASPPALPPPPDRGSPARAGSLLGAGAAADLGPADGSPSSAGRAADPHGVMEGQAAPERTESPKQRKAKTGVNLRKSLAWDSAFFTSEGVLDTEELAIVNNTFRKTQGSRLPGITEESRRSGESTTSTLESESWAMESIETELFDNVRASIQRSLGKPNKVPGGRPADPNPPKATANAPRIAARKGVDQVSQIKLRAPVSTSQGVGGKQRPQVTSKEPRAVREKTLPAAAEAKPSTKPPRAMPRVATMRSSTNTSIPLGISDKRSSTGGVINRQAVGKSANTSAGVRPGGVVKSSSVSQSGTSAATKTGTETKSATQSNMNRTAQRIPIRSSSRFDSSKTNPIRSSGNKIPARGHSDRASPCISPNSSVDSLSSVISGTSTASTVGKMSHTSESLSTQSSSLSPSLKKSNDHPLATKLRPPIVTEGQSSGTAASGDNPIDTKDTTKKGKGFKPSGLRRPTPKIGYFDAEKSNDQNSVAHLQVQSMKIQRSLPVTPKPEPSSTQIMNTASFSVGKEESISTASPEENGAPKSKVAKVLSDKVAQMEIKSFKVVEPEVCTPQTGPVVAQPEAEKSIVQNSGEQVQLHPMEIQCPLPATPNSQQSSIQTMILASSTISQQESKATAAPHDEISAFISEAVKVVPLSRVEQMEADPCPVAQMEIVASTSEVVKVAEPEACTHETGLFVAKHEAEKPIDQNIGAQVAPLKVANTEACMHQSSPVVPTAEASKENIPALHQNIQASEDASSLSVDLLIQKLSFVSLAETPDMAS